MFYVILVNQIVYRIVNLPVIGNFAQELWFDPFFNHFAKTVIGRKKLLIPI